jgi:hypothetical protein
MGRVPVSLFGCVGKNVTPTLVLFPAARVKGVVSEELRLNPVPDTLIPLMETSSDAEVFVSVRGVVLLSPTVTLPNVKVEALALNVPAFVPLLLPGPG